MTKVRRIVRLFVSTMLLISIILLDSKATVLATYSQEDFMKQDIISFDEYSSAIKAEYEKYGIKYEILEEKEGIVLTKSLLERKLETARAQGELYMQEEASKQKEREIIERDFIDISNIKPMVMYVNKTYYDYQTVTSPSKMGKAQICLEGQATADADTGVFLWVNYGKSYQSGPYINLKSWSEDSKDCFLYTFPGTTVKFLALFVEGTLTVEYTDPDTGLLIGYTSSHTLNIMWAY